MLLLLALPPPAPWPALLPVCGGLAGREGGTGCKSMQVLIIFVVVDGMLISIWWLLLWLLLVVLDGATRGRE